MLITPQQRLLQSVVLLLCLLSGISIFLSSILQIPDIFTLLIVVIIIYMYSRLVAPHLSETMIPELIILLISFPIFRLHEHILQSGFTELLTKITAKMTVNLLLTWQIVFIIISIATIALIYKYHRLKLNKRQFSVLLLGIPAILLMSILIMNINKYSFNVIDSSSLVFYRSQDIVRVDIIRDCSGIYGLIIFSCSFLLFGPDTKRQIEWNNKKTLLCLFGGLLGVYSINLLRIITVINASLFTDQALKSIIHSYLGSLLILIFIMGFWAFIWSNSLKKKRIISIEN